MPEMADGEERSVPEGTPAFGLCKSAKKFERRLREKERKNR